MSAIHLFCISLLVLVFASAIHGCESDQFTCTDGKCIPNSWVCDGASDCEDHSDEGITCGPTECVENEFQCDISLCIPTRWVCDGDTDCLNGSDEQNCENLTCSDEEFKCNNSVCIPVKWVCDKQDDCSDNSDENGCEDQERTCADNEMACSSGHCIPMAWHCDGDDDCSDGTDEVNCLQDVTCSSSEFTCGDGQCITDSWRCDGDTDCSNAMDETDCGSTQRPSCKGTQFTCDDGSCIHMAWVCDGDPDCMDDSDERDCENDGCTDEQFTCKSGVCIPKEAECDGKMDCYDASDESDCTPAPVCDINTHFTCDNGACVEHSKTCDRNNDCGDWSDEPSPQICVLNECKHQNGGCSQTCIDLPIDYYCECASGFRLSWDNKTCKDIDECGENPDICGHLFCFNDDGGFHCACPKEYVIYPDGVCRLKERDAVLLVANRKHIVQIDLSDEFNSKEILFTDLQSATALDVDVRKRKIYWTDIGAETINGASLDNKDGNFDVILDTNISIADGLVVDWVAGNIYWTDTGRNTVNVVSEDGQFRKTLFNHDVDEPRALAVDPQEGLFYWSDWGSNRIERAGMDGSNRQTILSDDLGWPNGISIDYISRKLYWVDAKLHTISYSDMDGQQRITLLKDSVLLSHPFSLVVFGGRVYWSEWSSESVYSVNKLNGRDVKTHAQGLYTPMAVRVVQETRQLNEVNYCGDNNGGCSHLCLLAPTITNENRYTCACPDGIELLSDDRTCYGEGAEPVPEPTTGSMIGRHPKVVINGLVDDIVDYSLQNNEMFNLQCTTSIVEGDKQVNCSPSSDSPGLDGTGAVMGQFECRSKDEDVRGKLPKKLKRKQKRMFKRKFLKKNKKMKKAKAVNSGMALKINNQ
ncbi:uncharacterized protein LOC100368490 [Saccoglossus kowalevskii]|uniref:Low-density lipoprotein receptor-related protein 1-like n=1 Tax=Saccoglossus kowalevskii TaxID=10224 RepID=A0ABM0GW18_SACKO|nr:PREDICTED: low-density lipoprotein receptor-related protein 1-like [Saccoglossus kowalevskii]